MISNDASALKTLAVSGSPKICASGHHLLIILKAGMAAEDRCSSQKKEEGKSRREELFEILCFLSHHYGNSLKLTKH